MEIKSVFKKGNHPKLEKYILSLDKNQIYKNLFRILDLYKYDDCNDDKTIEDFFNRDLIIKYYDKMFIVATQSFVYSEKECDIMQIEYMLALANEKNVEISREELILIYKLSEEV